MAILANTLATGATTFDDWRIRHNEIIQRVNSITENGNTITANSITGNTIDAPVISASSQLNLKGTPITTSHTSNVYIIATYATNNTIQVALGLLGTNAALYDHINGTDNVHNLSTNVASVADVETFNNKTYNDPVFSGNANFLHATGNLEAHIVRSRGSEVMTQGLHSLWLSAGGFTPHVSNGAVSSIFETATNQLVWRVLNFSPTEIQRAQASIAFPASYDKGTLGGEIHWYANTPGASGNTSWMIRSVAISNDDPINPTWGDYIYVTDQMSAVNDLNVVSFSGLTVGGTVANGDLTFIEIARDYANSTDSSTANAIFAGMKILYTIDARSDD